MSGVELVISDAHGGIKAAIAAVLGDASWQRCRTHFMANLIARRYMTAETLTKQRHTVANTTDPRPAIAATGG